MFKRYGIFGLILIVLVEANFFIKLQPFADWYYPIVWIGYILVIDALVFKLKKESLISNRFKTLIGMALISVLLRWILKPLTNAVNNWSYVGGASIQSSTSSFLFTFLSSAIILPALFETIELFRSIHLFDKTKLHKKHNISKKTLHILIGIGVICFILPFIIPKFAFPLIWLSFFFILDPINYLHKQPSVIGHLKDRKLAIPLAILLAGITIGFLWEFWNFWAIHKWVYSIPFFNFLKIFEMPILGYLGYFPFALELYAMYWFVRSLLVHKEHLLEE